MVRKLIVFLLCSLPAAAQFTTVSATVHDPTGLPYANGTVLPTIVCSASPRFLSSGFPYAPPTQASGLDSKGTYVQNLADVNQLTPAGCTWNFHVCSAAGTVQPGSPITSGPVCFDVNGLTITGVSQDISTQLNAAAPPLANLPGGGGGGMTWPTGGAGIPNYSGSNSWATTYNASNPIPANFIFNPLNQNTTGNAGTATALQVNPTICPAGQFAQGILSSGNATGCAAGGGGGSGTVSPGTVNQFAIYTASTTVGSNPNLTDSGGTITSAETMAIPSINLTGTAGTGASITSTGGTLPTLASGTGGLGVGTGGVPQMNLGTGAGWIPIPSSSGGVTSINTVPGAFTFTGAGVSCASTTCTFTGGTSGVTSINTVPGAFTFTGAGVSCASTTCTFTGGTGSGTVSPNNGNATALAQYTAAGGSTTVSPAASALINPGGGLTLPSGSCSGNYSVGGPSTPTAGFGFTASQLDLCTGSSVMLRVAATPALITTLTNVIGWASGAASLAATDLVIARPAAGILSVNGLANASEAGFVRSANSCAVVTPVSFTTTPGTICSETLPAIARNWIVHCVVPWQFTAGTGTATITFIVNFSGTPANSTWFTGILWGGTTPFNNIAQMTTGPATLSLGSVTAAAGATFSTDIDGVISAPAAGGTASIGATTSTGTGSMMAGSYCRFE